MIQSSTFGKSTQLGDSTGDALNFERSTSSKQLVAGGRSQNQAMSGRAMARPNPVTWMGGAPEPEPAPRRDPRDPSFDAAPPQELQQSQPPPQQQQSAVSFGKDVYGSPRMTDDQMGQTWSNLMRSGKLQPSAAQCMVQLPSSYSEEPKPQQQTMGFAMNTIGLHPANQGRPMRKSSKFTSDFRDPFL